LSFALLTLGVTHSEATQHIWERHLYDFSGQGWFQQPMLRDGHMTPVFQHAETGGAAGRDA
jgi:Zn/Cd-binding protein ZinT